MPVINNIPNASANANPNPLITLFNFPFLIFLTSLKPPVDLFGKARATAVIVVGKGAFTFIYIHSIPIGMPLRVLSAQNQPTLLRSKRRLPCRERRQHCLQDREASSRASTKTPKNLQDHLGNGFKGGHGDRFFVRNFAYAIAIYVRAF